MTILKLSKSGKQLQIIDDFGNVYGISLVAARNVMEGRVAQGFSMCTRLPFKVSTSRFGVSPVWDPISQESQCNLSVTSNLTNTDIPIETDALHYNTLKKVDEIQKYVDKEVNW